MSVYAQFGEDGPQVQVASNAGWSEFTAWVDRLPTRALGQLIDNGITEDLYGLAKELEAARGIRQNEDVRDIAEGLIKAVKENQAHGVVLLTNGTQ